MNKAKLVQILSSLQGFKHQDIGLEQYPTPAEIAAAILWTALMNKDIEGKILADLGCGFGVFGLGAAILGAKKIYMVDLDEDVLAIAKHNKKTLEKKLKRKLPCTFSNINVNNFKNKVDVVIENPPFGVKKTHSDKTFLLKAMGVAPKIYSFHKYSTKKFINSFVEDNGFKIREIQRFKFPLTRSYWFHIKSIHYVDVGCWILEKARKNPF